MKQNYSLKSYNTFGIDVNAKIFKEVSSLEEVIDFLQTKPVDEELFILNGGSNMLLTKDINAWVMKINLKGIKVLEETDNEVIVEAQAGENWHQFVQYCIENNWGGLENLSLIPGNVGASPIQNIGAYGVEIKDCFESLDALHLKSLQIESFDNKACAFGYRESVFKKELKDQYLITTVRFRLNKPPHKLSLDYGVIKNQLETMDVQQPTIKDVSKAVIAIRESKLPNPAELGNSGSFFKNPIVDAHTFEQFQKEHPQAPFYALEDGTYKIPAGWLIEHTGLKGYRTGDAGVHAKQALVLVNYGNATGTEIKALAEEVQQKVFQKFNINISPEVNIF